MNDDMRQRIVERASRHGVLLDKDDPAMLFADIAMLVADDRAAEVAKNFERDVEPAKEILARFESLSDVIGSDEKGLIGEIKTSIKTMEDAIADLGGAYDAEGEAAKRMLSARDEIHHLAENFTDDLRKNSGDLRKIVEGVFQSAISEQSNKIVLDLAQTLQRDLIHDVRQESVRHVLGKNIEEASKAALAKRVNELEVTQGVYKEHYKEANFWRGAAPYMIGLSIIGGASTAAFAALIYFINTGAIQLVY